MKCIERVWDFLNRDVSELFNNKEEYQVWSFKREDGLKEAKKIYSDGRIVSYEPPIFIQECSREYLLSKEAWLSSDM